LSVQATPFAAPAHAPPDDVEELDEDDAEEEELELLEDELDDAPPVPASGHSHGPSPVPAALQTCAPAAPPTHAHATCAPGVHTIGAPPTPELELADEDVLPVATPSPPVPRLEVPLEVVDAVTCSAKSTGVGEPHAIATNIATNASTTRIALLMASGGAHRDR
jgi:hypothetical protein